MYKVGIHRTYVIIVRMYVCMCVCVCVCVCVYIYIYIYMRGDPKITRIFFWRGEERYFRLLTLGAGT